MGFGQELHSDRQRTPGVSCERQTRGTAVIPEPRGRTGARQEQCGGAPQSPGSRAVKMGTEGHSRGGEFWGPRCRPWGRLGWGPLPSQVRRLLRPAGAAARAVLDTVRWRGLFSAPRSAPAAPSTPPARAAALSLLLVWQPLTAPALASHCPSGPSRTPTPRLLAARAVVVTPAAVPRAQARCSRGRVAEWRLCPPIGGAPGPATLATSMAPGFHAWRRPEGGFIQRTDTSYLRAPTHLGPCSEQGADVEECPGGAGGCREEGPPPELDRTAARGGGKPRARTASGSIS